MREPDLFMMCEGLERGALKPVPQGYSIRLIRPDELDFWKGMHFDDREEARRNEPAMTGFFQDVYAPKGDLFYQTCRLLCDGGGRPVGSCFAWRAYGAVTTIHWFKVLRGEEGKGLGRALLSFVMEGIAREDFPVYLHTQPSSFRAIKLYTDFGFALLTNPVIGRRENGLEEGLAILRERMPKEAYDALRFAKAGRAFLEAAASSDVAEF